MPTEIMYAERTDLPYVCWFLDGPLGGRAKRDKSNEPQFMFGVYPTTGDGKPKTTRYYRVAEDGNDVAYSIENTPRPEWKRPQ